MIQQAKSYLKTGEYMPVGWMASENGSYFAAMLKDGNFCVYRGSDPNDHSGFLWGSMSNGDDGDYYATMQADGNFVIYRGKDPDDNQGFVWATMTNQSEGGDFFITILNDGKLALYRGTDPSNNQGFVWASGSQQPGADTRGNSTAPQDPRPDVEEFGVLPFYDYFEVLPASKRLGRNAADPDPDWAIQKPSLALSVKAALGFNRRTQRKAVCVYLSNEREYMKTSFNPGDSQQYTSRDKKGYYLDQFEVRMQFQEAFQLGLTAPTTKNADNSVTSSVGFSASGGFFGASGVANFGSDWSTSTSNNYVDFTVLDHSDAGTGLLKHVWKLTGYDPESASPPPWQGAEVPAPPNSAVCNFMLLDQGAWLVPWNTNSGSCTVEIRANMICVEGTKAITTHYTWDRRQIVWGYNFAFDLSVPPPSKFD